MLLIDGYMGAILELFGFYIISKSVKNHYKINIDNNISYYWLCFTILTGFWELFYIINFKNVVENSKKLIITKKHIWFEKFNITMILPWNLSKVFYSEYGAYADREYMNNKNDWSRIIEGTHLFLCGYYSLLSLYFYINKNQRNYYLSLGIGMGCQLMNSILYISQYLIEMKNKNSINYNNKNFPAGFLLYKRPFMWINLFWTLMPKYILYINLYLKKKL